MAKEMIWALMAAAILTSFLGCAATPRTEEPPKKRSAFGDDRTYFGQQKFYRDYGGGYVYDRDGQANRKLGDGWIIKPDGRSEFINGDFIGDPARQY